MYAVPSRTEDWTCYKWRNERVPVLVRRRASQGCHNRSVYRLRFQSILRRYQRTMCELPFQHDSPHRPWKARGLPMPSRLPKDRQQHLFYMSHWDLLCIYRSPLCCMSHWEHHGRTWAKDEKGMWRIKSPLPAWLHLCVWWWWLLFSFLGFK